jgi:DNA mismatch repair protein MLH3
MAMQTHQIIPLSPEVQAQLKSSIAITSLSDVVIELTKNSLDAQARAIYIDVDYLRGGCSVEDDGHGIPARELSEGGHVGSMYCKQHSINIHATLTLRQAHQSIICRSIHMASMADSFPPFPRRLSCP